MKLYSSDADAATSNGHAPPIDDDEQAPEEEAYDYSELFDAPNYADFIKTKPNSKAQGYERRVASMMKAGLVLSINNQNWPDAATFLKHGPGFAKAAGNLAAEDARAAAIVEMLTAPDSPYVMFALIAFPMIGQLARNHQPEILNAGTTMKQRRAERKQAKLAGLKPTVVKPPITVHLFKREIKIPIRVRIRLPKASSWFKAFLAPTQFPGQITEEVFTDPAVIKALHKMGVYPQSEGDDGREG